MNFRNFYFPHDGKFFRLRTNGCARIKVANATDPYRREPLEPSVVGGGVEEELYLRADSRIVRNRNTYVDKNYVKRRSKQK